MFTFLGIVALMGLSYSVGRYMFPYSDQRAKIIEMNKIAPQSAKILDTKTVEENIDEILQ